MFPISDRKSEEQGLPESRLPQFSAEVDTKLRRDVVVDGHPYTLKCSVNSAT